MSFKLSALPYAKESLAPYISSETLEYHYEKHHKTYVTNLNNLIKNTIFETRTLEDIVRNADGEIFNNAAQVWNHTFYWHCLSPVINTGPINELADNINTIFGSFVNFKTKFIECAIKNFGSGWTWLVKTTDNKLDIVSTSNAHTPLTTSAIPLMAIDVWEHAYYIDYRNARHNYLENVWKIINWNFVEKNFNEK